MAKNLTKIEIHPDKIYVLKIAKGSYDPAEIQKLMTESKEDNIKIIPFMVEDVKDMQIEEGAVIDRLLRFDWTNYLSQHGHIIKAQAGSNNIVGALVSPLAVIVRNKIKDLLASK